MVASVITNVQLRYRAPTNGMMFNIPFTETTGNESASLLDTSFSASAGATATTGEPTDPRILLGGGREFDGGDYVRVLGLTAAVMTTLVFVNFGSVSTGSEQRLFNYQQNVYPANSNVSLFELGGKMYLVHQTTASYASITTDLNAPVVAGKEYCFGVAIDPTAGSQSLMFYLRDLSAKTEGIYTLSGASFTYHNGRSNTDPLRLGSKSDNTKFLSLGSRVYGVLGYNRKLSALEMRDAAVGYR